MAKVVNQPTSLSGAHELTNSNNNNKNTRQKEGRMCIFAGKERGKSSETGFDRAFSSNNNKKAYFKGTFERINK